MCHIPSIGLLQGSNAFERDHIKQIQESWDAAYKKYEPTSRTIDTPEDPLYDIFPGLERLQNSAQKFFDSGGNVEIVTFTPANRDALNQRFKDILRSNGIYDKMAKADEKLQRLQESGSSTERDIFNAELESNRFSMLQDSLLWGHEDGTQVALAFDADGNIQGALSYKINQYPQPDGRMMTVMEIHGNSTLGGSGAAQLFAAIKDPSAQGLELVESMSTDESAGWHILASRHTDSFDGLGDSQ